MTTNLFALPFFELQKAIYQKLSTCETLTAITRKDEYDSGVYDAVSEETPYPYVTISEPKSTPFDTKTANMEQMTFTIHAWWKDNDEYSGKRKTYEMLSACSQALHSPYRLNGAKVEMMRRREAHVFDDVAAGVKHGVLTIQYTLKNL